MTIRIETTGAPREVLPGIAFPPGVAVIAENEPWSRHDITVWVEALKGRLAAAEIAVKRRPGGPPVDGTQLRTIQVARLVRHAAVATHVSMHPDASELDAVAHMYRLAKFTGEPPTKTVSDQLGIARSTAGRLIAAARKAGLLK